MASTLDLYIDTSSGQLIDGGSVIGGALPTLTRNDAYTLRLRLLEKKANGSLDDIDYGPDLLIASLRISQVKGFCERATALVNAGRPACPFCGLPVDPLGHLCPRANGYRR